MNITVIDERVDKPSTMEMNGIVNSKVIITIGKDGGVSIVGLPDTIKFPRNWYEYNSNLDMLIQPCNGINYV
jgi:hypothetical protein